MTNEQIADFLAEKVMGWHKARHDELKAPPSCWFDDTGCVHRITDWHPTTDLNQAMQAATAIGGWSLKYIRRVPFWQAVVAQHLHHSALSPADALARAVVKAAGGSDV